MDISIRAKAKTGCQSHYNTEVYTLVQKMTNVLGCITIFFLNINSSDVKSKYVASHWL